MKINLLISYIIIYLTGGVLHLSSDGVCYLGDLNRLKKSSKEQIQSGSFIFTWMDVLGFISELSILRLTFHRIHYFSNSVF